MEKEAENLSPSLAGRMIEALRSHTQLSHHLSKVGVMALLDVLKEDIPHCNPIWTKLRSQICNYESIEPPEISEDQKKLNHIFRQLWYCKSDEQQRSWPIHEDELIILGHLENLHCILVEADPRICKDAISRSEFEALDLLATYYQMEPRRYLRLAMLKVFVACCELDVGAISHLLTTVLPLELARGLPQLTEDMEMFEHSSLVLTVLFSTGLQPPQNIYDQFNVSFLEFMHGIMEEQEDFSDQALAVLLAFNLHLDKLEDHPLLAMLSNRTEARVLTEKLIFLVNREIDPVKILNHQEVQASTNSVLKMLIDLFSCPKTDHLFYQNDVKVLLDIIVRQISDLSPGHQNRSLYLKLAFQVMLLPSYKEHYHKLSEIQQLVLFLQSQEDTQEEERKIIEAYTALLPHF